MRQPDAATKDVADSRRWAKRIRAMPQQCWRNAALIACAIREPCKYVEGFVILSDIGPIFIEHGWVEIDNRIIDPTLPDNDLIYFTGIAYEGAWLKSQLDKSKRGLSLPFNLGCENADYRNASIEVNEWVMLLTRLQYQGAPRELELLNLVQEETR